MGASKLRILFTVMIPESLGPLILGYTFIVIGVVDMSPWPGTVGGGGLGKVAIVDGYQRFQDQITWGRGCCHYRAGAARAAHRQYAGEEGSAPVGFAGLGTLKGFPVKQSLFVGNPLSYVWACE